MNRSAAMWSVIRCSISSKLRPSGFCMGRNAIPPVAITRKLLAIAVPYYVPNLALASGWENPIALSN